MSIDDFARYSKVLHDLTADFLRAVPEDKWDFTPDPPGESGRGVVLDTAASDLRTVNNR